MSNGEDTIDNWEEIDESGITEKLQKLKTDLKKADEPERIAITGTNHSAGGDPSSKQTKQMRLLQRNSKDLLPASANAADNSNSSEQDGGGGSFQPVVMVLHKPADEYQSANYAAPTSMQTVKILRRPTQSSEPRANGLKPKQPIKTLQQREQEYAEARLRILGSAKNPEDDACGSNNNTQATNSANTTNASATPPATASKTSATKTSPVVAPSLMGLGGLGPITPAGFQNSYMYQQQQQQPPPQQPAQKPQQTHMTPPHFYFHQQQQQQQHHQAAYINRPLPNAASPLVPQQHHHHQAWSPVVGGNVSSSVLRQQHQESILRLPRGPDGSDGFQMRR